MVDQPEQPPKKPSDDKPEGWVEELAKRSSGLPSESPSEKSSPENPKEKSPWAMAGLGIQFAGTVALFMYAGYKLDQWMGWKYAGLITLSSIAIIGNMYLLIKDAVKQDRPTKK